MKKTISINIGGIIFHIEEDGFDQLKNYLESVNKYFSRFDDSTEIITDIEGRIAELFLLKLSDGRQTLNLEDVNELISTMGTTQDFEASIEDDEIEPDQKQAEKKEDANTETEEDNAAEGPKRLYRDTKKGILGGVASGVAHYLNIDALWIRLLFLALLINIFFYGLSAAMFIGYILLWIAVPPNDKLVENENIKKLYRNPDSRVLGGVGSGLAAYFGIDTTVVRLLFVISIFVGGSGLLAYIILWIITPEAKTITDKMQMSGKPVTLKNIEDNLKKSFKVSEGEEEKPLVKVLLFPFRFIAIIIKGAGKILSPLLGFLVDAIRIIFGASLIIFGFSSVAILLALVMSALGFGGLESAIIHTDIPLQQILTSVNVWVILSVFLLSIIPAIGLSLLGLVIIIRKKIINSYVGWSLFALWVFGIFLASFTIPKFIYEFKEDSFIKNELHFPKSTEKTTLFLNDIGDNTFDQVELKLRGHADTTYTALIRTESRGKDHNDAKENAAMVSYNVKDQSGDFTFDSKVSFGDNIKYRFQSVEVTFYIPYNQIFIIDEYLAEILRNTIYHYGYKSNDIEGNEWMFSESGQLECLSCNKKSFKSQDEDGSGVDLKSQENSYSDSDEISYPFEKFNDLRIGALVDIEISKSKNDDFEVTVKGKEEYLDDVYLNQIGDQLEINFKVDDWKKHTKNNNNRVKVIINMPSLNNIEIYGGVIGEIRGFDESDMNVEILGESDIYIHCNVDNMRIETKGDSKLKLRGKGDRLEANIEGSSRLKALNYLAREIKVESSGISKAEVSAEEKVIATANGMSTIRYIGADQISIEKNGSGKVEEF